MNQIAASRPETPPPPRLWWPLRLLLVVGGALLIWVVVTGTTEAVWGAQMSLPKHIANAVGVCVLAVPLVIVARRWIDRRSLSTLGSPAGQPAWRDFLLGAATFLIPSTIGLTVFVSLGWLDINIGSSPMRVVGVVALLIALVFVYEAFPEELLFRGYLYRNISGVMAPLVAVVIQAVLFSVWGATLWLVSHGWGVFLDRAMLFFVMALIIGLIRLMSGAVWAAIGFHVAFQTVMQLFLNSHYADIEVSDEGTFQLATALLAFITSTTLAGMFWWRQHNWTTPEPDLDSEPATTDPASTAH